jgi:phage terminase large subunit GpA-like protein
LTGGIDVQKDRLEIEIVGWYTAKRNYSIDYRVLMGDTDKDDVWNKLAECLNEQWEREDGAMLPLLMSCIDTGYNTHKVYEFCQRFDQTRLIPIKGQDNQKTYLASPKAVNVNSKGKKVGSVKLWNVGVSLIKSEIYSMLKLNPYENEEGIIAYPPGYCHFPQYSEDHFKRLTNEKLKFKMVNGLRKSYWDAENKRNEQLDCRVYARAAASYLQIDRMTEEDYKRIHDGYFERKAKPQQTKKSRQDSFWAGRRD